MSRSDLLTTNAAIRLTRFLTDPVATACKPCSSGQAHFASPLGQYQDAPNNPYRLPGMVFPGHAHPRTGWPGKVRGSLSAPATGWQAPPNVFKSKTLIH